MNKYMIIITPVDIDSNLQSSIFTTSLDIDDITILLSDLVKKISIPNPKETHMMLNEIVYDIKHPRKITIIECKVTIKEEKVTIKEEKVTIKYCKGKTWSGMDCNRVLHDKDFCYICNGHRNNIDI